MDTLMRLPITVSFLLCLGLFACSDQVAGQKGTAAQAMVDSVSYGIGADIGSNIRRGGLDSLNKGLLTQGMNDALADRLTEAVKTVVLSNNVDTVSYTLGANIGTDFRNGGLDTLNMDLVATGCVEALARREKQISQNVRDRVQATMLEAQETSLEKQREAANKVAAVNKKKGDDWLAENANNPGIEITESGLQYRVMKLGKGPKPGPNDQVEVDYRGTLITGEEFDSSYKRKQTATFGVGGVIAGWTEGLQLMNEGSTYQFFIPSQLAYGPGRGPGNLLEPNSALVFEVVLHKVNP